MFVGATMGSEKTAAAFGGTTCIIDFAIQKKGGTLREALDTWHGKAEGKAVFFDLLKTAADKVPLVMIGYGRTDTIDGRYFPYAFPLVTTYQMQASAMLTFMAQRDKGQSAADLKGKKLAAEAA